MDGKIAMTSRTRTFTRSIVATAAAAAPVIVLAPSASGAPNAPLPRAPLTPVLPSHPVTPARPAAPKLPTTPAVRPMVETPVTRVVSVPVANVRSGPSTSYKVVGTKTSGTTVTGVITSNGWLKVSDDQFMAPSVLAKPQTPSSPTTVTQYVVPDLGNVRSGPGLGHGVVGTVTKGSQLQGTWVDGWLKIAEGRFVSGTILTSDAPAGTTTPAPPASSTTVTRWVTVNANVRSGPSTSYSIVGSRQAGAEVRGTLTSNGWLQIGTGQFLSPGVLTATAPSDGGGGAGGGDETTTVKRWVSAPVANVRSGPGTSFSVVGTKTVGTQVTGTVSTNGWLRMSATSWMSPDVLTATDPAAPAPAPPGTPAPVTPPSTGPAPVTPPAVTPPSTLTPLRQAILDTAAQYVGYPYVLYGTPPNAFDCSSYTWWVFKQNGINIPRTVADQKAMVTRVTDPQPGDLIFYDNFYHVGIYAGDGMTYEALNPSAGVRYGAPVSTQIWYGRIPGM